MQAVRGTQPVGWLEGACGLDCPTASAIAGDHPMLLAHRSVAPAGQRGMHGEGSGRRAPQHHWSEAAILRLMDLAGAHQGSATARHSRCFKYLWPATAWRLHERSEDRINADTRDACYHDTTEALMQQHVRNLAHATTMLTTKRH
jgi:hypothetical protein